MKTNSALFAGAAIISSAVGFVYLRKTASARPVTRSFPAQGVRRVVLRASQAGAAKVGITTENKIKIAGLPSGGAEGYHPSEPGWRETPARDWGLDFVAKRYGHTLVISTSHEIEYIHHHYGFVNLIVQVPTGVTVVKEELLRDGEGKPNLKKPGAQD